MFTASAAQLEAYTCPYQLNLEAYTYKSFDLDRKIPLALLVAPEYLYRALQSKGLKALEGATWYFFERSVKFRFFACSDIEKAQEVVPTFRRQREPEVLRELKIDATAASLSPILLSIFIPGKSNVQKNQSSLTSVSLNITDETAML